MKHIPVYTPSFCGNEKKYLAQCIDTGWISSEGPFITQFEDAIKTMSQRSHGIAVSNGTSALEIAVKALNIGDGDEVILPACTIISCSNAIIKAGAKVILVDVNEDTWNIDVSQIEEKITDKTKAIMVPHLYGLPAEMDPIIEISKKHDIKIIEDAAQMHGQYYNNRPCGSFGDISIFSFYANKLIATGEGGMIVTNSEDLAEKCRYLRNNCFSSKNRFIHDDIGSNMRMSNLQAAVGLAQWEQVDQFVKRKREIGDHYTARLNSNSNINLPIAKTSYSQNIYWMFGMLLNNNQSSEEFMHTLMENSIGARPFFWPIHLQPAYQKMELFNDQHYPVAERLGRQGLYLPTGLNLSTDQIDYICDVVIKAVK